MVKKKFKKIELSLFLLVILQIFILINGEIAGSYLISENRVKDKIISQEKVRELVKTGINLITGFLSIKQIGVVSAENTGVLKCCIKMKNNLDDSTKSGASCVNLLEAEKGDCEGTTLDTPCEQVIECESGCCYDTEEGLCSTKSPKAKCENEGGEWTNDKDCTAQRCIKGCCTLGTNFFRFITEGNCAKQSGDIGIAKNFQMTNELQCLSRHITQFEGACVSGDAKKSCTFGTQKDCSKRKGHFYEGYLCSYPDLQDQMEKPCESKDHIGCIDGLDEIYWFDSCGNKENIYGTKDEDWGEGNVVSKQNISSYCGANGDSDSSTCGNCARELGSVCASASEKTKGEKVKKDDKGNQFICKNLNCEDAPANVGTKDRKNGESWCLYDGFIGDGKDVVGSEHWKAYCKEGVVEIDRCGESRSKVCQESTMTEEITGSITSLTAKTFTTASCVMNEATFCVGYNSDASTMGENCNKNKHCMIKNVEVNEFKFGLCVPRYPKGLDLSDQSRGGTAVCNQMNPYGVCPVYYVKDWKGKWKCEENCNCEKATFAEQMNNICISLGDCGSQINYIGYGTDNVLIRGEKGKELDGDGKEKGKGGENAGSPPGVYSWGNYKGNEKPVKGQYVEVQEHDSFESAGLIGEGEEFERDKISNGWLIGTGITGATGALAYGTYAIASVVEFGSAIGATGSTSVLSSSILGSFGSAALGAALGAGAGYLVARMMGYGEGQTIALVVAGGLGGAISGILVATGTLGWTGFGVVTGSVIVAMVLYITITGAGDAESRYVIFECQAWEPPTGQENQKCEECNKDPLRPCTKYRCESLGQACYLINEEEENPICKTLEYETNPPIIKATDKISEGYQFANEEVGKGVSLESKSRSDGCIAEDTRINFVLETDEYAQCKWSFTKPNTPTYDEMDGDYPIERNTFGINHTFEINLPSIDNPGITLLGEDIKERYGDMSIYVRCMDKWKTFNIDEYMVNFCVNSEPDRNGVDHSQTLARPASGTYLKYGETTSPLKIWVNKPAECSYSKEPEKTYDEMTPMTCKNGMLSDEELNGWPCETTLTELIEGENKIYIKCKAQPWLEAEGKGDERAVNVENYEWIIHTTPTPLVISPIVFISEGSTIQNGGTFTKGGQTAISFSMEATTSGGADGGVSTCFWGPSTGEPNTRMYVSDSTKHTQEFPNRGIDGEYKYNLKCEDSVGNIATAEAGFTLGLDTTPPIVTRVSKVGNSLQIKTNEPAECYYNATDYDCGFGIGSSNGGISMTTGISIDHSTNWNPGQAYYIKCADIFGNTNPTCGIKIIAEQQWR